MPPEQIHTNVREDPALRAGFFALARETCDLDFEPWYRGGWWGERYIPYLLTVDGRAAANVSVNVLDTRFQGRPRRYSQLGTVMSAPAFRGRGYSRRLLETVLDRWRDRCDGVYLYANDSVLDFYPKFGFRPGVETVHSRPFSGGRGTARPLDVDRRAEPGPPPGPHPPGGPPPGHRRRRFPGGGYLPPRDPLPGGGVAPRRRAVDPRQHRLGHRHRLLLGGCGVLCHCDDHHQHPYPAGAVHQGAGH